MVRENGPHRYDVVLVDARAGLAETTAAALIGLGAHNLCFGIDTPPSHDGFRYLFSYLAGLAHAGQDNKHWAKKFRIVHAKALPGNEARRAFRDRVYEVFVDEVYDPASDEGTVDAFSFDYDDEDAPHWPWPIVFDATFAEFDPGQSPDRLGGEFAERAFGSFLSRLDALITDPSSSGVQ